MALQLELDTLDDLEEAFRPLYLEKDNKFILDVDGVPDVKGLKSAIEKERKTVKDLKNSAKAFEDIDTDKYKDLMSREAELLKHDPSKVEEMITARVKQNDDTWKEKYTDLEASRDEKDLKLSNLMVGDELRRIGTELGVMAGEPMNDFVTRGKSVFKLVEGKVTPSDADGVIYGESGVEALTMREFGKKLAETATHLFKSSSGGGAANSGSGNAGSGTVRYKSDFASDVDKAKFIGKNGKEAYLKLPDQKAS